MPSARLLATDLDGTFIGDDDAMFGLWEAVRDAGITLAFSTGRHLKSIRDFYAEKKATQRADVCVCMVGTDIHWLTEGEDYEIDPGWHEEIAPDWDKDAVEEILRDIPEARMQDPQWQSRFKSSYYLEDRVEQRLAEIKGRLKDAGIEAKVVYSASKFLDLLPARSGKGKAVAYVAEKLGVAAENVVTCGDTGNDLDMMRPELGFRSIVVANAAPELKSLQGKHVHHAPEAYAAGIHAVLKKLGWL